jgi:hypothetical protein
MTLKSHQDSLYEEIIQAEFTPERRPKLRWILDWSDCFGYQSSASLKRDAVSDIICREAFIDSAIIAGKVMYGEDFRRSVSQPRFYSELQRWALPPKKSVMLTCWGDYLALRIRSAGSEKVIMDYIPAKNRLMPIAEGQSAIEQYIDGLDPRSRRVVKQAITAVSRRSEGATTATGWVRERWMALALWDCSPTEGWKRVEMAIKEIKEQKKLQEAEPAGQEELSEPIFLVDPFEDSTTFPVKQPPRATSWRLPSPIASERSSPPGRLPKTDSEIEAANQYLDDWIDGAPRDFDAYRKVVKDLQKCCFRR